MKLDCTAHAGRLMEMPPLETQRLVIRPFTQDDLDPIHHILDVALTSAPDPSGSRRAQRQRWLQWTGLNYGELARLHQPPFGDRAVVLKPGGKLIGACGLTPCLGPFEWLPSFQPAPGSPAAGLYTLEIGLYYALSPDYHRQGYASEAAQALIDYAFRSLHLKRIVAMTTYDNLPSQGVMQKVGMHLEHNPNAYPEWFQVVGVRQN